MHVTQCSSNCLTNFDLLSSQTHAQTMPTRNNSPITELNNPKTKTNGQKKNEKTAG